MTSCVLLVAGHGKILEKDIETSSRYMHLTGVPKALLPGVGGKRILDYWWDVIKTRQLFNEVYLVTNADKYKHFERWATASDFPVENIVNDGSTNYHNRLGTVRDLELVYRIKNITDDLFVIAGDCLFQDQKFDFAQVLNYFRLKKEAGDLAIYYEMHPSENTATKRIVEVCDKTNRIVKYLSKPDSSLTSSRKASVLFYGFRNETLSTIPSFLKECHTNGPKTISWSRYLSWLINSKKFPVYGMKLPSGFQLLGKVGLKDYEQWLTYFEEQARMSSAKERIIKRAYARVGLIGNPSDGFYGKTIALSIANFWAEVTISESAKLCLLPHPLNDPTEFGSLGDLHGISMKDGYLGGLRLLQATCKMFYSYCSQRGIALAKRNFTLKYDTNIPRQVGLAGSSAIVTATLKCLMQFFNLSADYDMPKEIQPQLILNVEKDELFINAGLQDRVVQVYEGLVYMDLSKNIMDDQGHGKYEILKVSSLPKLWLAYIGDPSDSGSIHNDVSLRWHKGDTVVLEVMKQFASLTDEAKNVIQQQDWATLGELMNKNFELRRQIYGDEALGVKTLRLIDIGREYGCAVKLPGSGGAVVGLLQDESRMEALRHAYQKEGFVIVDIIPNLH